MTLVASKSTTIAPLPPACIVYVPSSPDHVITGSYLLNKSAPVPVTAKTGALVLYCRVGDTLVEKQSIFTQAVLDLKFSSHDSSLLAAAQSLRRISLFYFINGTLRREHDVTIHREELDDEVLVLSIAFSPTERDILAFTLTTGEVGLLSLSRREVVYSYQPHTLEAWTCEFSADGRLLYSGGDDSVFCCQDLETRVQVFSNRKAHTAGVTAILPQVDGTVLTGSYDDTLRVWDVGCRKVLHEVGLGGGVWRLLAMGNRVLASCMYAGARIIDVDREGMTVKARFEEHESMNYGSAWHKERPHEVVSCSFYDKKLCVWSI